MTDRQTDTDTDTGPWLVPGTLVFWCQRSPQNSTGVPYGGTKCRWGGSKSATFHKKKPAISQKWCKIDTWFLLKSNRKSYALYRMVTLSMTLSAPIVPSAACPVPISATCSCPVVFAAHLVNASENSQFGRFSPLANVVWIWSCATLALLCWPLVVAIWPQLRLLTNEYGVSVLHSDFKMFRFWVMGMGQMDRL